MELRRTRALRAACLALLLPACAPGVTNRPAAPLPSPPGPPPVAAPNTPGVPAAAAPPGESSAEPAAAPSGPPHALPPLSAVAPPPADLQERRAWLKARLDELFSAPGLARAHVSIAVLESDSGKPVYARGEKNSLNAASNVKLVTSAAALSLLGPEHRFRTNVYALGRPNERWLSATGELAGDLYLKGGGDPTLSAQDLEELASELVTLGLKKVHGGLAVDATFFDATVVGPAYDQKPETAAFRAPSSAASLNANAIGVIITPGPSAGAPARVTLDPPSPYFVIAGRVLTASKGPATPGVETADNGDGHTRIDLSGRVRLATEPRTIYRRVVHPELFVAHTFRQVLQRYGITFDKPPRVEAAPTQGLRTLASHVSPPLAVIVQEMNKRSSNFVAEQVLRALGAEVMGAPGSWDKGLAAVARYLEAIGLPKGSYRMDNGSGLYDSNRFSAEQMATIIRAAVRDFRIASEYLASLSLAGTDGTLAQRMSAGVAERYVRAKTGTLQNVSCLSGVAGAPGQRPLVFSLLMNDVPSLGDARVVQDRAAELLVWYLDPSLRTRARSP